ncbi:MAG: CoA transferase, partial [Litorivicinus sp.]
GIRRGPRTDYLCYDDLIQASTGIMQRFGGGMSTPEEHAHVGTIDVMCGFGAAVGIGAALFQKYRTGRIGRPRTSLAALTGLAQIPFCYDYRGRGPFNEPSGPSAQGHHGLKRLYPTLHGTIMLAAEERQVAVLAEAMALPDLALADDESRVTMLMGAFMRDTAHAWAEHLQAHDIGAAPCENIDTLRSQYCQLGGRSNGTERGSYSFSRYPDHPSGREVIQLDPYAVRPMRAPIATMTPSEKYGASTRAVLKSVGYDDDEIDRLVEVGSASERWSEDYFPS